MLRRKSGASGSFENVDTTRHICSSRCELRNSLFSYSIILPCRLPVLSRRPPDKMSCRSSSTCSNFSVMASASSTTQQASQVSSAAVPRTNTSKASKRISPEARQRARQRARESRVSPRHAGETVSPHAPQQRSRAASLAGEGRAPVARPFGTSGDGRDDPRGRVARKHASFPDAGRSRGQ